MSKLNETISKLEAWIDDQNAMDTEIDACIVADALDLLKEKQPKKVVYDINGFTHLPVSFCPSCGEGVNMYAYGRSDLKQTHCPYCGQALDWKDGDGE